MAIIERQYGVTLSDGTSLTDLFDLEGHRIAGRVFSDPEIFRLELERVFTRTWCFVGFTSEIPEPGDYVTRAIGIDPVIVSRDENGGVHVMLNVCTHRGTQLCVAEQGTSMTFKCPYHGWIFDCTGRLAGVPSEFQRFGPAGKGESSNLRRARTATYRGLIFATWNLEAPELPDYLGAARWYLDMTFGATDDDLVAVGSPQRWTVPCDWKYGAENFTGDGYHAPAAHLSALELGLFPPVTMRQVLEGVFVTDATYGHGLVHFNLPKFFGMEMEPAMLLAVEYPWLPPEALPEVESRLNPDQLAVLHNGDLPGIGTIFPNFSWLLQPTPGGPLAVVRTWMPVGPGRMELWSWPVGHPRASPELRRAGAQANAQLFGASGLFEQDDLTIWTRMQRPREGAVAREQYVDYSCVRAPDRSNYFPDGGDFPGPGVVRQGFISDDVMWQVFVRWYELMMQP